MAATGHAPEWPDKIMAAALFALLGSLLAVLHAGMQYAGVSFNEASSNPLSFVPTATMLLFGVLGVTAGTFAYIHQSWILCVAAILCGVLSFGLLGAAPLVSMVAIIPLVQSFAEGEETKLDRHRFHSHQWPDKAVMAGVVLGAAGGVTLTYGVLLMVDVATAPVLPTEPMLWGIVSIAAGLIGLAAGREVFRLRHAWTGWVGTAVLVIAAGFYVVGPILALVGLVYMSLAYKEAEFLLHS